MQRVMIVGGPGSGKSTLARRLGARTGLPVHHMDRIHHLPGWQPRPMAEKHAMAHAIEAQDAWIFEGGMSSTYDSRAARADTLVWLDLPLPLRLWRVIARLVRDHGQTRPDMADGCVESVGPHTAEFLHWIVTTNRTQRQKVADLIARHEDTLCVHHLTRRTDADRWLAKIDAPVHPPNRWKTDPGGPMTNALIVIDVQNDFCEGGALAVPGGSGIVAGINALMEDCRTVILTQDWHPAGHSSFATSHAGHAPMDVVEFPYGPQVLWPDHCIQGSPGAQFHPDLRTDGDLIVRKGFNPAIDSYSAFFENDHTTPTGLEGYLRTRGITHLTLVGLALDFCVNYSAVDAVRLGFDVTVRQDLSCAIDADGSRAAALAGMADAGVTFA